MAIADTITSMQTHTSNAYTMIGYGTDLTGINKNLENLSTSIFNAFLEALRNPNTLFTNLPKKSGTGANITLNDTANAPMRIELGASELSQSATPTPSSPQDIHTISGSNTIRVKNANVLNPNTFVSSTYITGIDNNTSVITFVPNTTFIIPTIFDNMKLEAGEYTIYCEVLTGAYTGGNMLIYDANNTKYTEWAFKNSDTHIFNLNATNGIKTIKLWNPTNEAITTIKLWIAKGTYTSTTMPTYEPYVSQEADIDLKSKNLFDIDAFKSALVNNKILNDSGVETIDNGSKYSTYKIYLKANQTYYLKGWWQRIYYYDASGNFKSRSAVINGGVDRSYTPTENEYIGFQIQNIDWEKYCGNEQVELGSTATSFVPYYDYGFMGSIGNYENIPIRTSGKNKFNINGTRIDGNATSTISNESIKIVTSGAYGRTDYLDIKLPKTAHTLSFKWNSTTSISGTDARVYVYDGSTATTLLTYSNLTGTSGNVNLTFTNTTGSISLRFSPNNTGTAQTITMSFSEIMLNLGSTALPYEPYGSNEWYIKKNIGKVVLDGTEDGWTKDGSAFKILQSDMLQANVGQGLSNRFKNSNIDYTYTEGHVRFGWVNKYIYFYVDTSTITDTTAWSTWLGSNNTIAYYILDTPTYTQITGTLAEQLEQVYKNMLSQKGTTNISQVNNDLSFNMSVLAIEE